MTNNRSSLMFLRLLELWTVSVGILLAVWYILLSNITGGVYLSGFTLVYLLMSWYLELGSNVKASNRVERNVGLWCSLLLPLVHMLSSKEEEHFLPLTVAVVFAHYTWAKSCTSIVVYAAVLLLLVQTGISLLLGSTVLVGIFILLFSVLYGGIQEGLSQSFTVGEGAIVSQLLTYFGLKVIKGVLQHMQGVHTEIIDKTAAVIFVSVVIATTLCVFLKLTMRTSWTFYVILGLVAAVILMPSVVFIIKFDGIKTLFRMIFLNKKSAFLFLWWVLCTLASIYIVNSYGSLSVPKTSTLEHQSDLVTDGTDTDTMNCSMVSSHQTVTVAAAASEEKEVILSCRFRKTAVKCEEENMEIRPEAESHKQLCHRMPENSPGFRSKLPYLTTQVRKLFHLVMIVVYVPGLMCNVAILYLASVAALSVLVLLEVIRVYKVAPLGPMLDQYFTVFLDKQDSGDLILTPLYLLIGCSLPLWFSHSNSGHADLKCYAGIISTGVGDAAASLVGQRIGKHRWPDTKKTVEGTLGAVLSQLLTVVILQILHVPGSSLSGVTMISVILISCLEAFSGHIDNLVVSLYAFMLFSTTGTFM